MEFSDSDECETNEEFDFTNTPSTLVLQPHILTPRFRRQRALETLQSISRITRLTLLVLLANCIMSVPIFMGIDKQYRYRNPKDPPKVAENQNTFFVIRTSIISLEGRFIVFFVFLNLLSVAVCSVSEIRQISELFGNLFPGLKGVVKDKLKLLPHYLRVKIGYHDHNHELVWRKFVRCNIPSTPKDKRSSTLRQLCIFLAGLAAINTFITIFIWVQVGIYISIIITAHLIGCMMVLSTVEFCRFIAESKSSFWANYALWIPFLLFVLKLTLELFILVFYLALPVHSIIQIGNIPREGVIFMPDTSKDAPFKNNLQVMYLYQAEHQFTRVGEMKVKALEIRQEDTDTLANIANLASMFRDQKCWKEIEELFVGVFETRKRLLGPMHPDTLNSMVDLGMTFWSREKWKEAEELLVQAMEMRKQIYGQEHLDIFSLAYPGWSIEEHWMEFEEPQAQVIEMRKQVFGLEHIDIWAGIPYLASMYSSQKRWKEAEKLQILVMNASLRSFGENHPHALASIANLAWVFSNQGRLVETEKLQVWVMTKSARVLGEEHPDTLFSIANLASTFWSQKRWSEAEELFVRVLEARKRILGSGHPYTLRSMNNLAATYFNTGQWKEASELFLQVVETRKTVFGEKHFCTLQSMDNLAVTYLRQERWTEAEELLVQAIETSRTMLGKVLPGTWNSVTNLTAAYLNLGRCEEAGKLYKMSHTRYRETVLGHNPPQNLDSKDRWCRSGKSQVASFQNSFTTGAPKGPGLRGYMRSRSVNDFPDHEADHAIEGVKTKSSVFRALRWRRNLVECERASTWLDLLGMRERYSSLAIDTTILKARAILRVILYTLFILVGFWAFNIFDSLQAFKSPINSFVACCVSSWSVDRMKGIVESHLQDPVIWWPWEQRLLTGHRRVYWHCVDCGAKLHDDEPVQDSSDSQSRKTSIAGLYDSVIGFFKDTGKALQRVLRVFRRWSKSTQCNPELGPENPSAPTQALNYLLLCVNARRNRSRLVQIPIRKESKDGWLFSEIRRQYFRVRGWRSVLTLRTVDSIRFVKFELYYKDFVGCLDEEIPAPEVQEYDYSPRPARLLPPQGPVSRNRLLHNFEEPHICQTSSGILPLLPKKKHSELHPGPESIEGWGLHVVEGISVARVLLAASFLITLTGAIWVGLWVSWKSTQDATSVAGVVGAMSSVLLVALIQSSL